MLSSITTLKNICKATLNVLCDDTFFMSEVNPTTKYVKFV